MHEQAPAGLGAGDHFRADEALHIGDAGQRYHRAGRRSDQKVFNRRHRVALLLAQPHEQIKALNTFEHLTGRVAADTGFHSGEQLVDAQTVAGHRLPVRSDSDLRLAPLLLHAHIDSARRGLRDTFDLLTDTGEFSEVFTEYTDRDLCLDTG